MTPESCPNCGADVPSRARACPQCGADESTGWSEEAYASSLNLPDDSFDYGEFVDREFGRKKIKPHGVKWHWWLVALALAALMLFGFLVLRK